MSQCKQSASEFIQSSFSPHIAVLCSTDAQLMCQKNNLRFVQLIQPFCRLSSEVHIRDANNVTHSIHNLHINCCDMALQSPQQNIIKKQLSDAVASTYGQTQESGANNMTSIDKYDLQVSASTPWFESWRDVFIQVLPPSDHEYLNHCLACIFVVASTNEDPLSTLTSLANQQVSQQQQFPNKMPRWFCQGVLHYYVLLHDVGDGQQARAEAVYQSMKATFGVQICHLLQINSQSSNAADPIQSGIQVQPDPWSQFLTKPSQSLDSVDSEQSYVMDESPSFPAHLSEGIIQETRQNNAEINSIFDNVLEESGSSGITSPSSCDRLSHPLASPTTPPNRDTPSPDSGYPEENRQTSGHHKNTDYSQSKAHGMCLAASDLDRLRIFMHEFVLQALIPWVERQVKILNDQLISRKGLHRSLFSATKKWFGTKPTGAVPATQTTSVVYVRDAPELQLRRLADLAFLFQMYDFAYNTYHAAKKDFNNDQAWLHFAGSLEMASLAVFLLDPQSQKQYPHHYMETAITTYLTSCRNPHYATRATLASTEALKKRGMFNEVAVQFLRLTSEDSDLTSALCLEQAAHCFLLLKSPMVRKYSFHMILAGHRFNKAGQRKHSLRCYTQALQMYKAKHWSIAEDHIHFTIGKQSINLKQLENATAAFKHLLTEESKQSTSQQAAYLREYVFVYKQLLSQEERANSTYGHLPELHLPIVDSNATRVLLASSHHETESYDSGGTPASRLWFDSDEENQGKWKMLEEKLVQASGRPFKASQQLFTNNTDNRSSPRAFLGEPITIVLQVENPLQVMLVLSDVSLLWTFVPSIQEHDPAQVISNEMTTGVKNKLADEIVHTSTIKEVIIQGTESEYIQLTLTPRQPGQLRVVGLAYNLGTSSLAQNSSLLDSVQPLGNQHKPSYTNSVLVRGKQNLEPQGPRLNSSKEERTHQLYGPDRRLDLLVHEEMPKLQVVVQGFPESLLCGQVQCVQIEFTNAGQTGLKSLRMASTHPRLFTFGRNSQLPKYPDVYQMWVSQGSSASSTLSSTVTGREEFLSLSDVLNIPLAKDELQPGQTITLPMWLRADDFGGIHEVDFMFYYEPLKQSTSVRHRVVRHRRVFTTVESLSVRTTVTRPAARMGSVQGQELNSCIFACELEHLSLAQGQTPHAQELQVAQVSCISPHWTLVSTRAKHQAGVRLGSGETLQLVMKGVKHDQEENSKDLVFSEIAFETEQVNSSCSPCSDFFVRSWLQHQGRVNSCSGVNVTPSPGAKTQVSESPSLDSAVLLKLSLVFFWKAHVVQENGQIKIVEGQHHVHVDQLHVPSVSCLTPPALADAAATQFVQDADDAPPPVLAITTRLVSYSLYHCHQREHRFAKGMCIVPVGLAVQNHTDREVGVMIDTCKSPESLSSGSTELLQPLTLSPQTVRWVGLTQTTLTLAKGQSSHLTLKAGLAYPGIYNLNSISVFVTFSSDQSQMVLQKHATPSIITLVDI